MADKTEQKMSASVETATLPDPLELVATEFSHTALIGVGVIGGSIGLKMKAMGYTGIIVGHDQPNVLDEALERGAIDRGVGDLSEAVMDADLIVLSTPIEETIKLLPTILKTAKPGAVVTDTAPVKVELAKLARETENAVGRYIGGHPLAGSSRQGVANADANLFDDAFWLLTPDADTMQVCRDTLMWWVRMLGAYPQAMDAETHDKIAAMVTHVPLMIALSLSNWVAQNSGEIPVLAKLATGNFQSMTSMAALPLGVWEGVVRSNQRELEAAMKEFREMLDGTMKDLQEGKFADLWQHAHAFQRKLARERPGDWDANCELVVTVADRPGTLARIAGLLAAHEIGIRDINVIYIRERRGGILKVVLESRADARRAIEILVEGGYTARLKD
ncbi:MAG TPA: prephenate dehydrogenase/arogenate dehydrogenase family protein [bacterium]